MILMIIMKKIMENKKQTAVEWLVKSLSDRMYIHCPEFGNTIIGKLVEEAKYMELRQKIEFARKFSSTENLVEKIKPFTAQMNMIKSFVKKKEIIMKKTAMQELIELIEIRDAYKEPMPYIIDVIKQVYIYKEKSMIKDAQIDAIQGADFNSGYFDCDKYYKETYKQ